MTEEAAHLRGLFVFQKKAATEPPLVGLPAVRRIPTAAQLNFACTLFRAL